MEEMCGALSEKVPQLTLSTTSDLMKEALLRLVIGAVNKERESLKAIVPAMISQEFADNALKIIEELFRRYMNDAFRKHNHKDHLGDDAPPEGEKSVKRQTTSRSSKSTRGSSSKQLAKESNTSASEQPQQQDLVAWVNILMIDEDEVIPKDETLEFLNEFQNVVKRVSNIYDHTSTLLNTLQSSLITFRDTLLQHMGNVKKFVAERTHYQRQCDERVNKRQLQMQESKIDMGKAVDVDLVVIESSGIESEVQDENSRSVNDTDANDVDIRPIYDKEPMAEVQLTAEYSGKGFCNCCFKNDLRKLKGNSVDTKFAKTSVLGKPILQSLRNQSVVRQPKAFKYERPQMSKQQFASQVDVNNNLLRPLTQHYLPKRRESVFAKPDHMVASSESMNSSKNIPRFSLNDMVHNHDLNEARKMTQKRDRNSKTSEMPSTRFQSTADGSKPKPRSTNQLTKSLPVYKTSCVMITAMPKADHSKSSSSFSDSKHFVCSTCHKCVFNENHYACITKLLKEVNSHAKIQSHKTRNSNKLINQKSHTQKPGMQIFTRHRFSSNKTSIVYEKTSPRSDLRWKPTSRIFKFVGLRWIYIGKLFDSCTSKDDSEPTHGSNVDISNIHESKQTLD
uniref:Uncharacterized protein n=1 Tax=Tanacetum cinerariifolium TaxID=118510 RepID=A0A699GQC3_TANCI|nr:hypothetical protein [Tanacetum cinerariifolium]